jgi:hypothetical protein
MQFVHLDLLKDDISAVVDDCEVRSEIGQMGSTSCVRGRHAGHAYQDPLETGVANVNLETNFAYNEAPMPRTI